MTTVGKTLVGVLGAGLLAAGPAFASSDDGDLAEMRDLVKGLEQKVEAQQEQIEHQGRLLQDAQKVVRDRQREEEESLSGLAEFWNAIDVNMNVAGSYAWNFNSPDAAAQTFSPFPTAPTAFPGGGVNQGSSGLFYPFHGDHNSFQVDQVYLEIGKEATDESRAGFVFTLLYGNTAAFLGQGGNTGAQTLTCTTCPPGSFDLDGDGIPDVGLSGGGNTIVFPISRRSVGDSTSDYYIHQAYVEYLAPIGEGVDVKVGKFATLIGAEVADTTQNFNITMGNIYNLFQPIDHLGVLASTSAGPISFAAGVVNEGALGNSSPDINKEKSFLGQIAYGDDMFGAGVTVLYGAEGGALGAAPPGNNEQKVGTLDFLATLNTDAFEAWVNADYLWVNDVEAQAWGLAIAGRVPITDAFSAALRAEYARDKGNAFGIGGARNSEVYGVTGTLAYQLVDNLMVRGEIRWDRVNENVFFMGHEFLTNTTGGDQDQVVGLAQVVYSF